MPETPGPSPFNVATAPWGGASRVCTRGLGQSKPWWDRAAVAFRIRGGNLVAFARVGFVCVRVPPVPSGCGVASPTVSSACLSGSLGWWVVERCAWILLLLRNGRMSGDWVVRVGRLRAVRHRTV